MSGLKPVAIKLWHAANFHGPLGLVSMAVIGYSFFRNPDTNPKSLPASAN